MAVDFFPKCCLFFFFACNSVIKIGQELLNEVPVERFILADFAIYYFFKTIF